MGLLVVVNGCGWDRMYGDVVVGMDSGEDMDMVV